MEGTVKKYSILVRRIVNIRIDGVASKSQTEAIARVQAEEYGNSLLRMDGDQEKPLHRFSNGVSVRYIEVNEDPDNAGFLVDEESDLGFEHSTWYAADGVTVNNPPRNGTTCDLCGNEIVSPNKTRDRQAAIALAKQALSTVNHSERLLALQQMLETFGQ